MTQSRHYIERFFRRVKIFPRLICVMLLISVLPMLLVTVFSYSVYAGEIKANTQQFLTLLVGNVTVQVQQRMETYEQMARFFYADPSNIRLLEENTALAAESAGAKSEEYNENKVEIGKRLYALTGGNRYVVNLSLVTPGDQYTMVTHEGEARGAVLSNIDAFRESIYYSSAAGGSGYPNWFDTTVERGLIQKYINSSRTIGNTLTMTVPVYTLDTRDFLGVLMLNVDIRFLTDSLTNYAFYGTGNTFLLGESDVLAILNPNINAPGFDYDDGLQAQILGQEAGSFTAPLNDRSIFTCFRRVGQMELYVAHIVDMDTILEPARQIRNRCLLLCALLAGLCVVLSQLTAGSIMQPISKLLTSMEQFGRDEFAQRVSVSGNDELTAVSCQFNQMAENTENLVEEILQSQLREKNLELSKATAELNALQMQINPHFLYNTMDLLRWEVIRESGGESNASRMVDSFSDLMRMSIRRGAEMVSVAEELEHARVYIEVVNFRQAGQIDLRYSVEFEPAGYRMPKLTLQPLLENSVVHGFTKQDDHPVIHVRGWKIKDMLMITVTDNGRGMDIEALEALRRSFLDSRGRGGSIGLRNVDERFRLCYGPEYGVTVESIPGMGTEITIRLPAGEAGAAEA